MSTRNTDISIASGTPQVENVSAIASEELPGHLREKGVLAVGRERSRFRSSTVDPRHSVKPCSLMRKPHSHDECKLNYIGTPLRLAAMQT